MFTGLSGSGKSCLAFDTIFAEGQRRYVESLSAYARQFLGQMDKPDVDFIEGLSPAVSIDQKSTNRNPRSTVGTITEVYDYLRLLFARAGRPHCPVCGEPITRQSPQQIVDRLLELPERTRFQVLAPVVRARKGEYVDLFAELQTKGFSRARVDGEVVSLTEPPKLEKQVKHTIDVVIDRLVAKGPTTPRPSAGSPTRSRRPSAWPAASSSSSSSTATQGDPERERRFSEKMACPNDHPLQMDEVEPRSFSFNSPFGACPECTGIGTELEVDPELIVPDEDLSLAEGAIAPWASGSGAADYFQRVMAALADDLAFSMDVPWRQLPQRAQQALLHGQEPQGPRPLPQPVRARALLLHRLRGCGPVRQAPARRDRLRLEPGALRGLHAGGAVPGLQGRPPQAGVARRARRRADDRRGLRAARSPTAARFFEDVDLTVRERQIAERVIKEINARLGFLLDVGLDYLSLDRPAGTLSGGEAQRIRLATQIGSGPRRGPLRPRRAEHRAAPARQPPPHRDLDPAARPRQHPHRRRARRGHHHHRRLGGRHRSRGGGARRPGRPLGHRRGPPHPSRLAHRQVPLRAARDPDAAGPPAPGEGPGGRGRRGDRAQPRPRVASRSRSATSSP